MKTAIGAWIAVLLLIASGCGGGTIGTGIVPSNFGMKSRGADLTFTLAASVRDIMGNPVPDVVVTVKGAGGTVSRKSDRLGRVRLPLMIQSGEFLDITVEADRQRYQSYQQISPAGASEIEQTLVIERSGGLTIE